MVDPGRRLAWRPTVLLNGTLTAPPRARSSCPVSYSATASGSLGRS